MMRTLGLESAESHSPASCEGGRTGPYHSPQESTGAAPASRGLIESSCCRSSYPIFSASYSSGFECSSGRYQYNPGLVGLSWVQVMASSPFYRCRLMGGACVITQEWRGGAGGGAGGIGGV